MTDPERKKNVTSRLNSILDVRWRLFIATPGKNRVITFPTVQKKAHTLLHYLSTRVYIYTALYMRFHCAHNVTINGQV